LLGVNTYERSIVYSHEDRVQALGSTHGIVLDDRGEEDEIWVPKNMIQRWIDDYEVSLQNLRKHIEPIVNTTDQARFKGKGRKRVWMFDKSALEESIELNDPIDTEENSTDYNSRWEE